MVNRTKLPPQNIKVTDPAYRSYLQKNNNVLYNLQDQVDAITVIGTTDQIDVSDASLGTNGSTTISLADNVKFPGTASIRLPSGNDNDRNKDPEVGEIRYNTEQAYFEFYDNTGWIVIYDWTNASVNFSTTGTVATGNLTVTGTATISSTLGVTGTTTLGTTNTGALGVTGNITVTGTVDGRDIATDGTKLDGIEAGANVTDSGNVIPAISGQAIGPDSIVVGAATGGNQGSGSINCVSLYDDGALVFDKVFYKDYRYLELNKLEKYIKDNKHLPTIPGLEEQLKNKPSVGQLCNYFYETIEVQALYILELNNRLKALEEKKNLTRRIWEYVSSIFKSS